MCVCKLGFLPTSVSLQGNMVGKLEVITENELLSQNSNLESEMKTKAIFIYLRSR